MDDSVHDRTLAPSPFPGDDGTASPDLRAVIAASLSGSGPDYLNAVVELCTARLLVPIAATATEEAAVHSTGPVERLLTVDKEADMAVVMMQAADGRTALLAFTGLDSQTAWDPTTRPTPVTLDRVAQTAVQQGASAIVVDIAGPASMVLEGDVLTELARGHRLVRVDDGFGWMQAG